MIYMIENINIVVVKEQQSMRLIILEKLTIKLRKIEKSNYRCPNRRKRMVGNRNSTEFKWMRLTEKNNLEIN